MNRVSPSLIRRLGLPLMLLGVTAAVSPTHAVDAPAAAPKGDVVRPFNGKDLSNLRTREEATKSLWKVVPGVKVDPNDPKKLVVDNEAKNGQPVLLLEKSQKGADLITEADVSDTEVQVEFMIPKGSNSGVYLMGQYEVQILDSAGKKDDQLKPGDLGGVYNTKAPSKNASKPAGEWQTLEIVFNAPRFDAAGKKTENAKFVSVKLNGQTIHENVEAKGSTGGELPGGEKPTGPVMIQGDHGPIAIRSITIKPIEVKK